MGFFDKMRGTVGGKAEELSAKVAQSYREHLGEELVKKQKELMALEVQLKSREEIVSKREANLNEYYLLPKLYIQVPIALVSLILVYLGYQAFKPEIQIEPASVSASHNYSTSSSGEANRAKEVQRTYNGIDMNNGKLDVGRYCLDAEKSGGVTFEQCIGMAGIKAEIMIKEGKSPK